MRDKIFLDLDGTLLDPRERLYALFTELAPRSRFSFDEYWRLKRKRINQRELLRRYFGCSEEEILAFKREWMDRIEEKGRLSTDRPLPYAEKLLARLSERYDLYLVTARQKPELVSDQIGALGWEKYFKEIFVTRQNKTKHDLVREHVNPASGDIFIGDTGEDILSGKALGIRTIAVASGFLGFDVLKGYNPDMIFESVKDLYENTLLWN